MSKSHLALKDQATFRKPDLIGDISHPTSSGGRSLSHTLMDHAQEGAHPWAAAHLSGIATCLSPDKSYPRTVQDGMLN